jgi:hypothetical protein
VVGFSDHRQDWSELKKIRLTDRKVPLGPERRRAASTASILPGEAVVGPEWNGGLTIMDIYRGVNVHRDQPLIPRDYGEGINIHRSSRLRFLQYTFS